MSSFHNISEVNDIGDNEENPNDVTNLNDTVANIAQEYTDEILTIEAL